MTSDVVYDTCRDCHQGIKRRRGSGRPWVHVRGGRAESVAPYDHAAGPVDEQDGDTDDGPKHLGNPVSRARKGWHGMPPS